MGLGRFETVASWVSNVLYWSGVSGYNLPVRAVIPVSSNSQELFRQGNPGWMRILRGTVRIGDQPISVTGAGSAQVTEPFITTAVEIVDRDDAAIVTDALSKSVEIVLDATARDGEIQQIKLLQREYGTGTQLEGDWEVYIFTSDPTVVAGVATLDIAAEWPLVLGIVKIDTSDWSGDTNGTTAFVSHTPIKFEGQASVWAVIRNRDAQAINSGAGDDEEVDIVLGGEFVD